MEIRQEMHRRYDQEAVLAAFWTYVEDRTEENRIALWAALLPLVRIWVKKSVFHVTRRDLDDDLIWSIAGDLWTDIPKLKPKAWMRDRSRLTSYFRTVIRRQFWVAQQEQMPEEGRARVAGADPYLLYEVTHHTREEGSIRATEDRLFLSELPVALENLVTRRCRFAGQRDAVRHCVRRLMRGKQPIPSVMRLSWGTERVRLMRDWTLVQIREFLLRQSGVVQDLARSEMEQILA